MVQFLPAASQPMLFSQRVVIVVLLVYVKLNRYDHVGTAS